MVSPPRSHPAAAAARAPTATASPPPQPLAASHPLPRAFLATSSPRAAAAAAPAPPLFTGRPLNPNPPGHASSAPHGILYPIATSAAAAHHRRGVPPVAVGYPRAHAVAVPIAQPQQQPLAYAHAHAQPRSFAAVPRALVAGVAVRPEQPPRGVPIAPQPKVNPVPPTAPSNEQNNSKDRERSREDSTTVVINDRKVNLLDSESGSLYALCRSWVHNGIPRESQPSFANGEPILPRPLPASVIDSRISEKEKNDALDEDSDEEPQKNADGEYIASDLLKQHVKRAKKIRAGLQKERLRRIERYKQRLALLLPPPSELGRHDPL
ncbi:uncharacterized protein LOC133911982 [Phragmites australis]|uniref:uncharacterized protein LOC133911982 n=1 Tax=Phragmites australis TaxID=29695 RepID=UPI002D7817AC|nr:uncharacterized protein LOC133911982 [Phragmites australis]